MTDDRAYLDHILECIRRIEANVLDGRHAFMASHTLQDAVLRNLQTMTEATQRVSEGLKARYPHIPWRVSQDFEMCLCITILGSTFRSSGPSHSTRFLISSELC